MTYIDKSLKQASDKFNERKSVGKSRTRKSLLDELTQLRQQLAAKDAEVTSWKDRCARRISDIQEQTARHTRTFDKLKSELSAEQALLVKKDKALQKIVDTQFSDEKDEVAMEAIAIKSGKDALREVCLRVAHTSIGINHHKDIEAIVNEVLND